MLFVLFTVIAGIMYYDSLVSEISFSVQKCLGTVVPSLYGSMIIACLVTESRLHVVLGKIFSVPARFIFRMPPEIFSVFLISNISGYPTGTKLLKDMLNKGEISESDFDRYCSCCFSAGPAFVTGTAASFMSGSVGLGTLIFLSNLCANFLAAFIIGRKSPVPPRRTQKVKCTANCSVILRAVDSASHGMLQMCSVIVAFSVFKTIIVESGAAGLIASLISGMTGLSESQSRAAVLSFIEITNISELNGSSAAVTSLMAALFSTGGICVIMQIFSIANEHLNRINFLKMRLFSACGSFFIFRMLYGIFFRNAAVSASSFCIHPPGQSFLPSILIIMMSIMLISTDRCKKT
ncbi:MAG: hypothetical protein E7505_07360 [Ruminococcus sp.]|nr:hypothetical protein [Ruminococcus sp.]